MNDYQISVSQSLQSVIKTPLPCHFMIE